MHLDLSNIFVGQELAIDSARGSYLSYQFCTVLRVTKAQVEVQECGTDGKLIKFSKATGRPLKAAKWDERKRLVLASDARDHIDRYAAMQELRAQRYQIKARLTEIANGHWTKQTVSTLRELADSIELIIE